VQLGRIGLGRQHALGRFGRAGRLRSCGGHIGRCPFADSFGSRPWQRRLNGLGDSLLGRFIPLGYGLVVELACQHLGKDFTHLWLRAARLRLPRRPALPLGGLTIGNPGLTRQATTLDAIAGPVAATAPTATISAASAAGGLAVRTQGAFFSGWPLAIGTGAGVTDTFGRRFCGRRVRDGW
jgi:hypothetical protein